MITYKTVLAAIPVAAFTTASLLSHQYNLSRSTCIWFTLAFSLVKLVLLFCFHAYVYPYHFSVMKDVRIPPGATWWGGHAFLDFGGDREHGSEIRKWARNYSDDEILRPLDLFHRERLLISGPAALQEVLNTKVYDFVKPEQFRTGSMQMILGSGILVSEGDVHKKERKQLNPAFHYRHIKDLYPKYWDVSLELAHSVAKQIDVAGNSKVFEPNELASLVTLDILGRAGLGIEFGAIQNPKNDLTSAYRDLFDSSLVDLLFALAEIIISSSLVLSMPTRRNRLLRERTGLIRRECRRIIREKKASLASSSEVPDNDILTTILSEKTVSFTEDEMVEQLVTFLVAGHETTAGAVAWTLHTFCRDPTWQTRLQNEMWDNIPATAWSVDPDERTPVTAEMIEGLPLLHAFCAEILRLYPPVAATVRVARVDTEICGQPVPEGTEVILAPWSTNVHPKLWGDEPEAFKPERWLNDPAGGAKNNYANMTFIHGPRSCIGQNFARAEFTCIVAAWVANLDVAWHKAPQLDKKGREVGPWKQPKPDFMNGIAVRPTKGWKVEVKRAMRP